MDKCKSTDGKCVASSSSPGEEVKADGWRSSGAMRSVGKVAENRESGMRRGRKREIEIQT